VRLCGEHKWIHVGSCHRLRVNLDPSIFRGVFFMFRALRTMAHKDSVIHSQRRIKKERLTFEEAFRSYEFLLDASR